jgi:hypothetical protein
MSKHTGVQKKETLKRFIFNESGVHYLWAEAVYEHEFLKQ